MLRAQFKKKMATDYILHQWTDDEVDHPLILPPLPTSVAF